MRKERSSGVENGKKENTCSADSLEDLQRMAYTENFTVEGISTSRWRNQSRLRDGTEPAVFVPKVTGALVCDWIKRFGSSSSASTTPRLFSGYSRETTVNFHLPFSVNAMRSKFYECLKGVS